MQACTTCLEVGLALGAMSSSSPYWRVVPVETLTQGGGNTRSPSRSVTISVRSVRDVSGGLDQATASTSSSRTLTALPRVCPTDRDLVSRRRNTQQIVDALTPKIGDLRISNGRSANHDAYDRLQRRQGRSSTIGLCQKRRHHLSPRRPRAIRSGCEFSKMNSFRRMREAAVLATSDRPCRNIGPAQAQVRVRVAPTSRV